jgi:hypothetical protein
MRLDHDENEYRAIMGDQGIEDEVGYFRRCAWCFEELDKASLDTKVGNELHLGRECRTRLEVGLAIDVVRDEEPFHTVANPIVIHAEGLFLPHFSVSGQPDTYYESPTPASEYLEPPL